MKNKNYGAEFEEKLNYYLSRSVPSGTEEINKQHLKVVTCYSYHCPFSGNCLAKTKKPAKVSRRKCLRFIPEGKQPPPALSELALDLLSVREQKREKLTGKTKSILSQYRPNGPLRQAL